MGSGIRSLRASRPKPASEIRSRMSSSAVCIDGRRIAQPQLACTPGAIHRARRKTERAPTNSFGRSPRQVRQSLNLLAIAAFVDGDEEGTKRRCVECTRLFLKVGLLEQLEDGVGRAVGQADGFAIDTHVVFQGAKPFG